MIETLFRRIVRIIGWFSIILGCLAFVAFIITGEKIGASLAISCTFVVPGYILNKLCDSDKKQQSQASRRSREFAYSYLDRQEYGESDYTDHTPPEFDASSSETQNSYLSSRRKGRLFEEYIITRFDHSEYRLIEWRSDKYIFGWGGPVSCQWPDLVMEHISTGNRFAIECKFRSHAEGNRLQWARPEQLQNYRDYEIREKVPVYIAIGLGGEPNSPESLFIVRLERMKFPDVMLHYLEGFRFPAKVTGLEFG